MKALLLNPVSMQKQHIYNIRNKPLHFFNMALLYLASFLHKNGISSKIIDLGIEINCYEKILEKKIYEFQPDFIVIGIRWYFDLYSSLKIAELVKKINKDIPVIAGGQTASYFDREIIKQSKIDYIIRGDAEIPLLSLIKKKKLTNLTLKKDDKIIRTPLKFIQEEVDIRNYKLIKNLGEILDDDKKVLKKTGHWAGEFIWAGKGCNYNCFYCSGCKKNQLRLYGRKKPIFRSIDSVIWDINTLLQYSNKIVFDFDPYERNKTFYYKLFKKIGKSDINLKFYSWTLPPQTLLYKLKNTFATSTISLSVETYNERYRKNLAHQSILRPFFTNFQLEKMTKSLEKNNQFLHAYFIAGLPQENNRLFNYNIHFIKKILKKYPSVFTVGKNEWLVSCLPLSIEPGSDLFLNPKRYNAQLYRTGFEDFYMLSKDTFLKNKEYPFTYKGDKFGDIQHPYGVVADGSSEQDIHKKLERFYQSLN